MTYYELIDMSSAGIVAEFTTRAEAERYLTESWNELGSAGFDGLALVSVSLSDREVIARSTDLVNLVNRPLSATSG